MTTVVTSWGPAGWLEYGQHFLRTFAEHWPGSVKLVIYTEGQAIYHGRPFVRDLKRIEAFSGFVHRHQHDPRVHGRSPVPGWRSKDHAEGYSFRHDAFKFCRKVFAVKDAADLAARDGETLLVWIDGDVVTHADVHEGAMAELLGEFDVAYLGREGTHSECGFLAFRLPEAMPLIDRWWAYYAADGFLDEAETHDSYLYDRARARSPEVRQRNLTPGGWGAVWTRSPLALWSDHRKGARKQEPVK